VFTSVSDVSSEVNIITQEDPKEESQGDKDACETESSGEKEVEGKRVCDGTQGKRNMFIRKT
jgi:hypothetical protein